MSVELHPGSSFGSESRQPQSSRCRPRISNVLAPLTSSRLARAVDRELEWRIGQGAGGVVGAHLELLGVACHRGDGCHRV